MYHDKNSLLSFGLHFKEISPLQYFARKTTAGEHKFIKPEHQGKDCFRPDIWKKNLLSLMTTSMTKPFMFNSENAVWHNLST